MIPCYSLFLEVEVPDPALNYFIIQQDTLDNDEHLIAPPPLGGGLVGIADAETRNVLPVEIVASQNFAWDGGAPPAGTWFQTRDESKATPKPQYDLGGEKQGSWWLHWEDTEENFFWNETEGMLYFRIAVFDTLDPCDRCTSGCDNFISIYHDQGGVLSWFSIEEPIKSQGEWVEYTLRLPDTWTGRLGVQHEFIDYSCEIPSNENNFLVDLPIPECQSGLNTFTLGQSCLNSDIDLLEGWGSTLPDHIWVDVITDATEIEIRRGFDMKQGIVGTPIAGIMEANVMDPYLSGINTALVAVGQRVRLRAGNEIVFSGVCNAVRSEYDAVSTPVLRITSVDALGLLNAQMVDPRPREYYNTRIAEAASKVDLPILQQESTTTLEPTEDAMSALELLVETQDSEGSVVWLDRFGTLYSTNRYWLDNLDDIPVFRNTNFAKQPQFEFSNNPVDVEDSTINIGGNRPRNQICLSSYRQVADTSQVINGITFYNFVEEETTDSEGFPVKTIVRDTFTYESANSRRLYGDAGVKLTTYLPPTDLVGFADYIFGKYDTPQSKVETIQFPLDKWQSIDVPPAVVIDVGDPVKVRIDDPFSSMTLNDQTQRVAQIRHKITPTEWLCELDLL